MDLITLTLLALGLSTDAFAVSVTDGICDCRLIRRHVFSTALTFALFQALMPVLGFCLGRTFSEFVGRYQHWIALFLLGAIGVNMLEDTVKEWKSPGAVCPNGDIFTVKNLIMQGIATSIDALVAGVSIAVLNIEILSAAFLIGIITFVFCSIGVYLGKRCGAILGLRARLAGGIVLILIGLKIFIQGRFF